ncbi:MAG: HNH endonuclease [Flavobacteriales bacterium]|nr:HNH endonuclease [Flavobacteriales bacterium]
MLTQEQLKEFLHYCPKSGVFTWNKPLGIKVKPGSVAGSIDSHGYILITINRKHYKAHRLAFLYMENKMPEHQGDHINHVRTDNRWKNLRCATHSDNGRNTKLHSNNKSGISGISFSKDREKWQAFIKVSGKNHYLGRFKGKFEACCARKSAEIKCGFHENHGDPLSHPVVF